MNHMNVLPQKLFLKSKEQYKIELKSLNKLNSKLMITNP